MNASAADLKRVNRERTANVRSKSGTRITSSLVAFLSS